MKIRILILIFLTSLSFISCDDGIDFNYSGPSESLFLTKENATVVFEKGGKTYIEVGTTKTAKVDRKIYIEVLDDDASDDVAREGEHYLIQKEVTIPADSISAKVEITPIEEKIGSKKFKINLKLSDKSEIKPAGFDNTLSFTLGLFIPYDAQKIPGNYVSTGGVFGDYLVEVKETDDEHIFEIIEYFEGAPSGAPIKVYLNGSDDPTERFYCEVLETPDVVWFTMPPHGRFVMESLGKQGKFSMIDETFSIHVKALGIDKGVAIPEIIISYKKYSN